MEQFTQISIFLFILILGIYELFSLTNIGKGIRHNSDLKSKYKK